MKVPWYGHIVQNVVSVYWYTLSSVKAAGMRNVGCPASQPKSARLVMLMPLFPRESKSKPRSTTFKLRARGVRKGWALRRLTKYNWILDLGFRGLGV